MTPSQVTIWSNKCNHITCRQVITWPTLNIYSHAQLCLVLIIHVSFIQNACVNEGKFESMESHDRSPDDHVTSPCCNIQDFLSMSSIGCPVGSSLAAWDFARWASLCSFFHFILLFWNQIFICRSVRFNAWAISMRRRRVRYLLKWNSFSSSSVWCRVYEVLVLLLSTPFISAKINKYNTWNCSFSCTMFSFSYCHTST